MKFIPYIGDKTYFKSYNIQNYMYHSINCILYHKFIVYFYHSINFISYHIFIVYFYKTLKEHGSTCARNMYRKRHLIFRKGQILLKINNKEKYIPGKGKICII